MNKPNPPRPAAHPARASQAFSPDAAGVVGPSASCTDSTKIMTAEAAADALHEEAARIILRLFNPGEADFQDAMRLVDCIVSTAMIRGALVQAEAVKHMATSNNP